MKADPPLLDHEAWSDAQDSTEVLVDGHDVSMAYRDEGPKDAHAVVFLHGIPTWSFLWRRIAPALEENFRTIVPDLIGYGNSARHDGFDRSIRAQELAVAELIDTLDLDAVTLVAHDIGGGVGLRYAAHHPDRVKTLVLSNSVCYDAWPTGFINELSVPTTAQMDEQTLEKKLEFAFAHGLYDTNPDPEWLAGMKAPWMSERGRLALARAAVATNTNHTMEIPLAAIEARTYCLWGSEDAMMPIEYAEQLCDDLDGTLVPIDQAYHWVVEDQPKRYRAALADALN